MYPCIVLSSYTFFHENVFRSLKKADSPFFLFFFFFEGWCLLESAAKILSSCNFTALSQARLIEATGEL